MLCKRYRLSTFFFFFLSVSRIKIPCNVKFPLKVVPGSPCGEEIAKSAFPILTYRDAGWRAVDSRGFVDPETEVRLLSFKVEPPRWRGAKGHHQLPQSPASPHSPAYLQLGFDFLFPISFSILSSDKDKILEFTELLLCQALV